MLMEKKSSSNRDMLRCTSDSLSSLWSILKTILEIGGLGGAPVDCSESQKWMMKLRPAPRIWAASERPWAGAGAIWCMVARDCDVTIDVTSTSPALSKTGNPLKSSGKNRTTRQHFRLLLYRSRFPTFPPPPPPFSWGFFTVPAHFRRMTQTQRRKLFF